METSLVAVIALLAILAGTGVVLVRQRMLPWSLPSLGSIGGGSGESSRTRAGKVTPPLKVSGEEAVPVASQASHASAITPLRHVTQLPDAKKGVPIERPGASSSSDLILTLIARVDGLDIQTQELSRAIDRQAAETRRAHDEQAARTLAAEAQRDAALERLRADLVAAAAGGADRRANSGDRRSDVSAELYARLARLEAALAAVTNPILLPGEAYESPSELLPEALVWENWNEVGERAFALADAFSAQRLYLSEQTRVEFGDFVTSLRVLLTRSIYPNLQPEPGREQQVALRAALDAIAVELPRARATIEEEFRADRR